MQIVSWLKNWQRRRKPSTKLLAAQTEQLEVRSLLTTNTLLIGSELCVESDGNDTIRVSAIGGNVLVETGPAGGILLPVTSIGTVPASAIETIVIKGGDEENTIDLSGVLASDFINLTSIQVDAGNGDDSITGSPDFADSLSGENGADTIVGLGGDDTLDGGDGADSISGGAGNDSILAGDGSDNVDGDGGNDTIDAGNGDDTVVGDDGDDSVFAGNGQDSVNGNDGNDTLNGDGGIDTVSGDAGDDSILGGEFDDSLLGGTGNDTINGQGGQDTIDGEAGDDSLLGSAGRDRMQGGDGNDLVNGGSGNDTLEGGAGNDRLLGGSENDVMFDDFQFQANSFIGVDTMLGQGGDDTLFAGGGPDSLDGGTGNDLLDTRIAGIVIDDLSFNEGDVTNTVSFNIRLTVPSPSIVTVSYATSSDGTDAGGTAIAGVDYLSTSGSVTFLPGETLKAVSVTILGDTVIESDETFFVNLTNPVNAQLNDPQAEGRMINDDIIPPPPVLDVVLLLDDTGSFSGVGPLLVSVFPTIIAQLQMQYPGGDFAFGITRFEDYNSGTSFNDPNDKPFTLNQPVITDDTPGFQNAIDAALNRTSLGFGGSGPESDIEALFQIATGAGFDGNGDGDSTDAGPAGPATTQTNTNGNGDVPAYSTFVPDAPNNVLPPTIPVTSSTDGVGFRPGARHIVLLATDAPFTVQPDGLATYTGVGGVTVPASQMTLGADLASPGNRGATIQNTVNALVAQGIQVVGLGDQFFGGANTTPRPQLEGLAILTGALNTTTTPIENFITPGPSADDIQPGDPLFFRIDPSDPNGLATAIVLGITGAVGTVTPPPPPPPPPPPALPGPQADTLIGGDGNDTLLAGDFDDSLNGGGGNDSIEGGGGNDSITGGAGADLIDGQAGDDTLNGQGGTDTIRGGTGHDVHIWEGEASGNDSLSDVDGDNTLVVNGSGNSNTFSVSVVDDAVVVTEGTRSVSASPIFNTIQILGNNGDDTVNVGDLSFAPAILLDIQGGNGNDVLSASGNPIGDVRLNMDGGAGNDTVQGGTGDETLRGGLGNDFVNGGAGNDTISGGAGNDTVEGADGNDSVNGDGGQDTVRGGAGDDSLDGSAGDDSVDGGIGNDTMIGNAGDDSLTGGFGNDSMLGGAGLDILSGGDGNDTLDGGRNDDVLSGGIGDDRIRGDHGNDTITGDDGNDTISGGDGNDVITGGNGNDALNGADGDDTVNGMAGNDTIVGGDGRDNLRGGGGNDVILGQDGDDNIDGQSGTDTVAGNQGADTIGDGASEINEAFTLAQDILDRLNAL